MQEPKTQKKIRRGMAMGLFLITLLIVVLLYPNTQNFRYSYQMGKPWQYETLYAPFQFPVKKTEQQINVEKEKLLSKIIPYYNYDASIGKIEIIKATKDSILTKENIAVLRSIYAEPVYEANNSLKNINSIYVVKNHISTEMQLSELRSTASIHDFLDGLHIAPEQKEQLKTHIKSNLSFNKEQTEALNKENNVSAYLGEVQANELIISRGEIVTQQSYRILESLRNEYRKRIGTSSSIGFVILGQVLFAVICLLFLYIFLRNYRKNILYKPLYLSFILIGIVASVALTRISLNFGRLDIYLIPYALFPIIIRTFMDSRTAMFTFLATILICSFIVPQNYEFLLLQLIPGIIGILYLKNLDRRSQLLLTALIIFVSYSILYTAIYSTGEGQIETLNPMIFVRFFLNAIFLTVAYPLLYLLEKTFGFLSDVTLIELSNTNNKLLRELSQVAPGTFQHSMQMANLAEEAVRKIGGNPLLVRAGALYHDIGKMKNPIYFTENQHGEETPHLGLSYEESANIIISHITDGIKMAKKYGLPSDLIDFIATHHGTGRTEYFYRSHINENPDKAVDESIFSYPGPDPFTVEQAILMMADSCEAATRSLKKKTVKNITKMVTDIIDFQKDEGRFNNAPVTFKDIELTKEIFIKKLTDIYHSRIAYPEKTNTK